MSQELTPILLISSFLVIVAIGIIMLVLLYQKKQIQNLKEKEQLKAIFDKEILESKLEIQEQTLQHISQEIHDNIGQELIFAKMTVEAIEYDETKDGREKLENASQLISKALRDLRNLAKSLNTDYIADIGLVQAIENEVAIINKTGKYTVCFQKEELQFHLSHQQELILFRIFQEVINNIIKHSRATQISINIQNTNEGLALEVTDNGKGFDVVAIISAKQKMGLGLRNMKARTEMIGGTFHISSGNDQGTLVRIFLPALENHSVVK